jgi:methionine-rich copper-binding protein CopC
VLAVFLGAAVLGPAALGPATSAWAHSVLVSMSPAVGSTVAVAPTEVVLTFDEAVQDVGDAVLVTAPDGTRVDDGQPVISGATVTERLKPLPVVGRYSVTYRVVSDDGHPVTRTLAFTFDGTPNANPAGVTASASASDTAGSSPAGSAASKIAVLALLLLAGVVALLVVLVNQRSSRSRRGSSER